MVRDAFIGYGRSQRRRFENHDDTRSNKYAVAYLRSLYNGWELLTTGDFTVRIRDTEIGLLLETWKMGIYTYEEVMSTCSLWLEKVEDAYTKNPDKKYDLRVVNDFLVDLRKRNW